MPNLILTRREGETLKIGDDIYVTVVEVRSCGAVRLAVQAPREVRVDRLEIAEARKAGANGAGKDAAPADPAAVAVPPREWGL